MNSKTSLAEKLKGNSPQTGIKGFYIARARYNFGVDGGALASIIPKQNTLIPKNAVIVGGSINVTTAVTSSAGANVSIGTSAGSSATSILAATAKASLSANALLNAVPVFATPVKMSAAGYIAFLPDTTALTAGIIEVALLYYVANA